LMGATTNHATAETANAPKSRPATTSAPPHSGRKNPAKTRPHSPPQNASDQTSGTLHGAVACME
jgi:hypothetical protein